MVRLISHIQIILFMNTLKVHLQSGVITKRMLPKRKVDRDAINQKLFKALLPNSTAYAGLPARNFLVNRKCNHNTLDHMCNDRNFPCIVMPVVFAACRYRKNLTFCFPPRTVCHVYVHQGTISRK